MKPCERTYTTQDVVEGVRVIGFLDRGPVEIDSDASYDRDVAEFRSRMDALGEVGHSEFAVVDFSNYRMTEDNGRAVVSLVLGAHRRLKAQGGGLFVCNHPAQLSPDWQHLFRLDKMVNICRGRREALEAALSRRMI